MNNIIKEQPGNKLSLINILAPEGWIVVHSRLFDISPEIASSVEIDMPGTAEKFTAWDFCFVEDLVLMENPSDHLILDIGWHPNTNPKGAYHLTIVRQVEREEGSSNKTSYDWDDPIVDYSTRSLQQLLEKLYSVLGSCPY